MKQYVQWPVEGNVEGWICMKFKDDHFGTADQVCKPELFQQRLTDTQETYVVVQPTVPNGTSFAYHLEAVILKQC